MLAKIQDILRLILSQVLPLLGTEFSRQCNGDLTQSSWAKLIKSYCCVPEAYNDFFGLLQAAGRPFPYTVLIPSHRHSSHRTSEKLICVLDDAIYVLELNEKKLAAQCYPLEGIYYVEFLTALLASSFTICGANGHGVSASSTLIFNSVTDYLFTPILNRARRAKMNATTLEDYSNTGLFDHLVKVNYKFMRYAQRSLPEGERVVQFILQPEIREKLLTYLQKTYYRTISPAHMSILTDCELILIREDPVRRVEDKYGGIWDYIPLCKIKSLCVHEHAANLLLLTVLLPENICFELLFQIAVAGEVEQLVEGFKQLTKR